MHHRWHKATLTSFAFLLLLGIIDRPAAVMGDGTAIAAAMMAR